MLKHFYNFNKIFEPPVHSSSRYLTRDIVNQMAVIVQKRTSQEGGGGHLGWVEKAMQDDFIVLLLGHLYKTRPSI